MKNLIIGLTSLIFFNVFSQIQHINITAKLDLEKKILNITQKITFDNYSKDTLNYLYLHNWANSYNNKNTPLTKRLLEDYNKSLYFAKKEERGFSIISDISNSNSKKKYKFSIEKTDFVKINLIDKLKPGNSVSLIINYIVKIPKDSYTGYGFHKDFFRLKYWYLLPAVYNNDWKLMNNYNLDDLYSYPTNYNIKFILPKKFHLLSNLASTKTETINNSVYHLNGKNQTNAEVIIGKKLNFIKTNLDSLSIYSEINKIRIDSSLSKDIIKRQINFIEAFLGKYPFKKILVDKTTYNKNPVYGLNQLPSIFNPFNDIFKFDIQHFKTLTNKYINNSIITNKRTDYWINDGIQVYLMIKYIEKFYPEKKALGAISKIWGIRSYKLAKLNFNDKYAFVQQFALRKNIDQSLVTSADSLSTFNRKIINKYKAGLGLIYLDDYIGNNIINQTLKEYYTENILKINTLKPFKQIINHKTKKNIDWFFNDYLKSTKKINYTIKKVYKKGDSLKINIKNKSDFTSPIAIYGIKNKEIRFKKWIADIKDFKTITIPTGDFNQISINYENKYPELNLNDNWKNIKPSLFNKPLQFRFIKDIDNPHFNQVFYNIDYDYNYYDGVILGVKLSNKTLFKKKWVYKIKPTYGFKSNQINGSFTGIYTLYPKETNIYKFRSGVVYSKYNYAPNLSYQRFSPYAQISFKRKSLREVGGKYISARYLVINKESLKKSLALESDNYAVLNVRYLNFKPNIINNFRYNLDFQLSKKFSKLSFELEYRKLQKNNTQIDTRIFIGSFIKNNTTSGFFNYSLNRSSDYLFDYNYFGRSEKTGFLSQQIIISEGGFKSFFENNSANQWMITSNNSIGIWRWIELYGDLGFYKSKNNKPKFKYDSGLRLNFVQNFFEVYFPIQSSNGFEIKQKKYSEKIRFVLTLDIGKIYNFIKRGFY